MSIIRIHIINAMKTADSEQIRAVLKYRYNFVFLLMIVTSCGLLTVRAPLRRSKN